MQPFPDQRDALTRFCGVAACTVALALAAGCHEPEVGYTEVKRIDEVLTERDFADLVAVLAKVDEQDRRELPCPFLPPPAWPEDRTLPVHELLEEERVAAERAWEPEEEAAALPETAVWEKALQSRNLTRQQFASLVLTVAAALGRLGADPRFDLEMLAARGAREIAPLVAEERTFESLPPEERHATLLRAAWLTTAHRASRLALVPQENVTLVEERQKQLRELLPEPFFRDPFAGLYPRSADYGVPFDEGALSDADLSWSADQAIIGTDLSDGVRNAGGTGTRY
jgi:hypothetical protein